MAGGAGGVEGALVLPSGASTNAVKDTTPALFMNLLAELFPGVKLVDAGAELRRLRRSKEDDEVEVICKVIEIAEAAYASDRQVLRPGISEIEVYSDLHAAMTRRAGDLRDVRGDFASGPRSNEGGAPTSRTRQTTSWRGARRPGFTMAPETAATTSPSGTPAVSTWPPFRPVCWSRGQPVRRIDHPNCGWRRKKAPGRSGRRP